MTEAEWEACTDPDVMVRFLAGRTSSRKLRWFTCACCRRLWEHLKDEDIRKALVRAERYADGLIADSTADRWFLRTCRRRDAARPNWKWYAYQAVAVAVYPGGHPAAHHHVAQAAAERTVNRRGRRAWQEAYRAALLELVPLLRDVAGDPFRPAAVDPAWLSWNDGAVVRLSRAAYDERQLPGGALDTSRLAVLADALEEAGCDNEAIVSHLRQQEVTHYRGCWVIGVPHEKWTGS